MSSLSKLLIAAFCLGSTVSALAGTVPYPDPGHIAATTPTYASSSNGVGIDMYYYGSSAGYNDTIQVLDLNNGFESGQILANHSTNPGTEDVVGAGHINQGDEIVFLIDSPEGVFASDPALSSDGENHVYITTYAGGVVNGVQLPAGLFLGFEDEKNGDWDYNDLEVVSTGVTTTSVTPEPSSLALFGTGVLGVAGVMRRRFAA